MSALTAGTAVVLRTGHGRPLRMRVLAPAELSGAWSVPVMVAAEAPGTVRGVLEIGGAWGLLQVEAELVRDAAGAVLRAPGTQPSAATPADSPDTATARNAVLTQRRAHVRAQVVLAVRGVLLDGPGMDGEQELSGHSTDLSGAGLALAWDTHTRPSAPEPGRRLYLELTMPGGELVPAVVEVVAGRRDGVQVRFVDLAPIDREHLIALVFAVQRRDIALRGSRHR